MNTYADKTSENKSQVVTHHVPAQQGNDHSTLEFADNQSETIPQMEMPQALNNSPGILQRKAFGRIANNNSRARKLKEYQAIADNFTAQAQQKENPPEVLQGQFITSAPIIQLMKIRGTEVNEGSDVQSIKKAMGWNPLMGTRSEDLAPEEILELKRLIALLIETEVDDDLSDMLESLQEKAADVDEDEDWDAYTPAATLEEIEEMHSQFKGPQRQSAEEFGWENFPNEHQGLVKIGVHETSSENVMGLVATGPAVKKMDSGHHLGKGPGFYVTPVGGKQLSTVTKGISYGDRFVAIYVPNDLPSRQSKNPDTDNTKILDGIHGEGMWYYIMSGGGEIVIPPRCFHLVRAVSEVGQL